MRRRESRQHRFPSAGRPNFHAASLCSPEPPGTVWVSSLHPDVTESTLRDYFSAVGPISTTSVERGRDGRYFGFVNYCKLSDAQSACRYNNTILCGNQIKVSLKTTQYQPVSATTGGTIWIGSLSSTTDEDDLRQVFAAYEAKISSVSVALDEYGNSKKFAFVNFFTEKDARSALLGMSGLTIAGKTVKKNLKSSFSSTSPHSAGSPTTATFQTMQSDQYGSLQAQLSEPRPRSSAPRAANSMYPMSSTIMTPPVMSSSLFMKAPVLKYTIPTSPKGEFADEDPLVVKSICAKLWKELVSEAKKVQVFVERPRDENIIAMKGNPHGISQLDSWLTSKATELKKAFSTNSVVLDAIRSPALHMSQVWLNINKLEKEMWVEIMWPGKDKQQGFIAEERIVHGSSNQKRGLQLLVKNILTEECGAIICGTTCNLDTTTGLAKALVNAGGPSIQSQAEEHIESLGEVAEGEAVSIDGGLLKCKWLIFAVIPQCERSSCSGRELSLFQAAVKNALDEAGRLGVETVTIPALKAGSSPFPIQDCATVTVQTVRDYFQSNADSTIRQARIVLPSDASLVSEFRKHFDSVGNSVRGFPQLRSSQEFSSVCWEYKSDNDQFETYESAVNQKLEEAFKIGPTSSLAIRIKRFTYTVNFSSMTQTNNETGRTRSIRRVTTSDTSLWHYLADNNTCRRYDNESNAKIEHAYTKGLRNLTININGFEYQIDLKDMTQTNTETFTKRQIMRQKCPQTTPSKRARFISSRTSDVEVTVRGQSSDVRLAVERFNQIIDNAVAVKQVQIPKDLSIAMKDVVANVADSFGLEIKAWSSADDGSSIVQLEGVKQSLDKAVQGLQEEIIDRQALALLQPKSPELEPEEWEPQIENLELKLVHKQSQEYQRIRRKMRASMSSVKICKLERIQNKWLWRKYVRHKEAMSEKNKGAVNEKELFHGTSSTDPEEIYRSEDGFDMRYSRAGLWGQGSYFAEMASYSDRYSYNVSGGVKQMFVANVLTGESANLRQKRELRMPPEKDLAMGGIFGKTMRYDTVTGITNGCRIYVTYNNDKAYPFYLITYTDQ